MPPLGGPRFGSSGRRILASIRRPCVGRGAGRAEPWNIARLVAAPATGHPSSSSSKRPSRSDGPIGAQRSPGLSRDCPRPLDGAKLAQEAPDNLEKGPTEPGRWPETPKRAPTGLQDGQISRG
eukprot:1776070-Pyramimonas_sp.AAC.1